MKLVEVELSQIYGMYPGFRGELDECQLGWVEHRELGEFEVQIHFEVVSKIKIEVLQ